MSLNSSLQSLFRFVFLNEKCIYMSNNHMYMSRGTEDRAALQSEDKTHITIFTSEGKSLIIFLSLVKLDGNFGRKN